MDAALWLDFRAGNSRADVVSAKVFFGSAAPRLRKRGWRIVTSTDIAQKGLQDGARALNIGLALRCVGWSGQVEVVLG